MEVSARSPVRAFFASLAICMLAMLLCICTLAVPVSDENVTGGALAAKHDSLRFGVHALNAAAPRDTAVHTALHMARMRKAKRA